MTFGYFKIAALAAATVIATAGSAMAVPITTPTSLSPGDQYRLAFVTSIARDANSTDIADYNAFVTGVATGVAELNALGTSWTAIVSTSSINARDNTSTVPQFAGGSLGVPIFLLNDTKLIDSYDDLWDGTIDVSFNIEESGNPLNPAFGSDVWTGTGIAGLKDPTFPLGPTSSLFGSSNSLTSGWTGQGITSSPLQKRMYGISEILSVSPPPPVPSQVPEPGTFLLFCVGLAGLGYMRGRRAV